MGRDEEPEPAQQRVELLDDADRRCVDDPGPVNLAQQPDQLGALLRLVRRAAHFVVQTGARRRC